MNQRVLRMNWWLLIFNKSSPNVFIGEVKTKKQKQCLKSTVNTRDTKILVSNITYYFLIIVIGSWKFILLREHRLTRASSESLQSPNVK